MILGDSLQVMASLAEREDCADRFGAFISTRPMGITVQIPNFQWSTTSRDVKDGTLDHITRRA